MIYSKLMKKFIYLQYYAIMIISLADAVDEWICFKRPKTIADGEDYCQFIYSPKKSQYK